MAECMNQSMRAEERKGEVFFSTGGRSQTEVEVSTNQVMVLVLKPAALLSQR